MYGPFRYLLTSSGPYFGSSIVRHSSTVLLYLSQFSKGISSHSSHLTQSQHKYLTELNDLCLRVLRECKSGDDIKDFAFSSDIVTLIKFGNVKESLELVYCFCDSPKRIMSVVSQLKGSALEALSTGTGSDIQPLVSYLTLWSNPHQVHFLILVGEVALYNSRCERSDDKSTNFSRLVSKYWKTKIMADKTNLAIQKSDQSIKHPINEEDYLANYSTEQELEELVFELQEEELYNGFLSPYISLVEVIVTKSMCFGFF